MIQNDISQRIRDLRAQHKLTLEQVAQIVGVGRSTVRKWETGIIENMRRDKIAKLAEALHTTPGYLMGWDSESSPPLALLSEHSGYWDGNRLREERDRQGYSIAQISELLDVSEEDYVSIESGGHEPTFHFLLRLADVFAYDLDYMCHRTMKLEGGVTQYIGSENLLIKKYRALDGRGQSAVWNTLNHEYESLSGDKVNLAPKEA